MATLSKNTQLRSLVIAENLPYPSFKGGDLRTWQNVIGLLALGPVAVFGLCSNDRRAGTAPRAGIEIWRTSTDATLTFEALSGAAGGSAARPWWLSDDAHPSDCYYSQAVEAELRALAQAFEPDLVIVERLWLHAYIPAVRRQGCRVVLDSHNLEAVLFRQLAAAPDGAQPKALRETLVRRTEALERRAAHSVDAIWVCSDQDAALMKALYRPRAAVYVVPNGIDVESTASHADYPDGVEANRLRSRRFIFPAMFGYAPNARSARFLIDAVLPQLCAQDATTTLLLVGGMPTDAMRVAAAANRHIVVTGTVAEVRPWLDSSAAMLVPLFEGSGTRFKILEAFAARLPVVTTARGAEGLSVVHGDHVLFAETAEQFAAAAELLSTDTPLAERLVRNAFELVRTRYSWDTVLHSIAAAAIAVA